MASGWFASAQLRLTRAARAVDTCLPIPIRLTSIQAEAPGRMLSRTPPRRASELRTSFLFIDQLEQHMANLVFQVLMNFRRIGFSRIERSNPTRDVHQSVAYPACACKGGFLDLTTLD